MHAEDDRYAKLFPFTEKEVKMLCETGNGVRNLSEYPLFILSLSPVKY